jgi:hypothetical protein
VQFIAISRRQLLNRVVSQSVNLTFRSRPSSILTVCNILVIQCQFCNRNIFYGVCESRTPYSCICIGQRTESISENYPIDTRTWYVVTMNMLWFVIGFHYGKHLVWNDLMWRIPTADVPQQQLSTDSPTFSYYCYYYYDKPPPPLFTVVLLATRNHNCFLLYSLLVEVETILWPTVSRPVCLGVGHPSGAHDQIFITVGHLRFSCGCPPWREDGSVICSYNSLSFSGPSPAELVTISYCFIWDSPNLQGQVLVFMSPRNRVVQLYPRTLGSLFVASYDSQNQLYSYSFVICEVKSSYSYITTDGQSVSLSWCQTSLSDPQPIVPPFLNNF